MTTIPAAANIEAYHTLSLSEGSSSIRVLDVFAPSTDAYDGGPLQSRLRVVDLAQRPSFVALSYVWGFERSPPIQCGRSTIFITQNGHSALKHLRRKLGGFTVWIDAICINQNDLLEKSSQISLMRDIYSSARSVYVWLGDGNKSTNRAMAYLGTAGFSSHFFVDGDPENRELPEPKVWPALWSYYTARWSRTRRPLPYSQNAKWRDPLFLGFRKAPLAQHTSYDDLNELLSREYIKRIWTYQELMFSSNPIVACGDCFLPWSRFTASIIFLDVVSHDRRVVCDSESLTSWKNIAFSRPQLRVAQSWSSTVSNASRSKDVLEKYHDFVEIVFAKHETTVVNWISPLLFGLFIPSFFILGYTIAYHAHKILFLPSVILLLAFVLLWASVRLEVNAIIPKRNSSIAFQEGLEASNDLLEGISTRRASDPKDMAFGVQPVMQEFVPQGVPPPDYSLELGKIYKDLSKNLVQAMGSVKPLIAASLHRLPGQPSWVADWSAEFPSYWMKPTLAYQDVRSATPGTTKHYEASRHFKGDILSIKGMSAGTVRARIAFEKTSDVYEAKDDPAHFKNLQLLLAIFSQHGAYPELKDLITTRNNHPELPQDLQTRHLERYYQFLGKVSRKCSTAAAFLSLRECKSSKCCIRRMIFRAHIAICNSLARTRRSIFFADCHERYTPLADMSRDLIDLLPKRSMVMMIGCKVAVGVCMDQVQAGDDIILIQGLQLPLVVRPDADVVRLLSPAIIFGAMQGELWEAGVRRKKRGRRGKRITTIKIV